VYALVQGNNSFAVSLFDQFTQDGGAAGNLFISPYSVSSALAMTYAGALGSTADQMKAAMQYPDDGANVAAEFGALNCQLTADGTGPDGGQLDIANTLYGQKTWTFQPSFLDLMQADFGAPFQLADFQNAPAAAEEAINAWVSQQTRGNIPDLLPPGIIDSSVGIVLVNALYFQGRWRVPFQTNNTSTQPFHVGSSRTVEVPIMSNYSFTGSNTPYIKGSDFAAVELATQSHVAVDLILPDDVDGLPALEAEMTPSTLATTLAGFQSQRVNMDIPKLKLNTALNLKAPLEALGMTQAFGPTANFTGIDANTNGDEFIQLLFVQHQAVLDLEEGGLSAAGATAVGGATGGAVTGGFNPISFDANHPFLIVIRDLGTGAILFMGQVTDPSAS
jgi:serpin B